MYSLFSFYLLNFSVLCSDNMSIPTCEKVIVLQMAQELSKPAITSEGSGKTKPSRSVSLTPEHDFPSNN